jgi:hypothetical protein
MTQPLIASEPASEVDLTGTTPKVDAPLVKAAFGAANRSRLIKSFLASEGTAASWQAVYKLILWTNKTTGLAHCYESDKCQPGKNWHGRSLRFHDWLAQSLESTPAEVGQHIDWLFRHVADDYARFLASNYQKKLAKAEAQRLPYLGRNFPEPGDDPGIVRIVREVLGDHLTGEPSAEQWRMLTTRILDLITLENKRKNIVGEGFEDVLAAIIKRADTGGVLDVQSRRLLGQIWGFENVKANEKPVKVDLSIVRRADLSRTMVSVKWSTRADREEQFKADWQKYVQAESANQTWRYVMVTNEFDPARLKRACNSKAGQYPLFAHVVHICPAALRAVYAALAAVLFQHADVASSPCRGRRPCTCRRPSAGPPARRSALPSRRRCGPASPPARAAHPVLASRSSSKSTATRVMGSGWHSGTRSACAWRPGWRRCARCRSRRPSSPGRGDQREGGRLHADHAVARATRCVSALADTSTMCAWPWASKWVRPASAAAGGRVAELMGPMMWQRGHDRRRPGAAPGTTPAARASGLTGRPLNSW